MTEATEGPSGKGRETRRSILSSPYLWFFFAGIVTITLLRPFLRYEPPPPPVLGQVPPFELVDESGAAFGSDDLAGQVYVADFIFTRCTSICPLLTRAMAALQERYAREGVDGIRLVSVSVDPEYDTPERLRIYAELHGADLDHWTFLTGDLERVRDLIEEGFKLAVGPPDVRGGSLIDIAHSGRFVLVDGRGGIRGYYDTDEAGLDEIFHRSQHVLAERRD